jgi:hypothetical protein
VPRRAALHAVVCVRVFGGGREERGAQPTRGGHQRPHTLS